MILFMQTICIVNILLIYRLSMRDSIYQYHWFEWASKKLCRAAPFLRVLRHGIQDQEVLPEPSEPEASRAPQASSGRAHQATKDSMRGREGQGSGAVDVVIGQIEAGKEPGQLLLCNSRKSHFLLKSAGLHHWRWWLHQKQNGVDGAERYGSRPAFTLRYCFRSRQYFSSVLPRADWAIMWLDRACRYRIISAPEERGLLVHKVLCRARCNRRLPTIFKDGHTPLAYMMEHELSQMFCFMVLNNN